jgi:acetylornithine deacetylase/succinyl-diaminopimelate desuccinylase-like protein
METNGMELDWLDIRQEMVHYLRKLIAIDTSSDRHRETVAASYLMRVLKANGHHPSVIEPIPGKGSLLAHIRGKISGESLLLLSHLDVAPATKAGWKYPPFSGLLKHGEIWGRGTIDCKGLVVVGLMLVLLFKRLQVPCKRGIVFAALADEETGGRWGAEWLFRHTDEWKDCRYALNEGGGFSFEDGKRRVVTCQVAEKGLVELQVTLRKPVAAQVPVSVTHLLRPSQAQLVHSIMGSLLKNRSIPELMLAGFPYEWKTALIKRLYGKVPIDFDSLFYHTFEIKFIEGNRMAVNIRVLPGETWQELEPRIYEKIRMLTQISYNEMVSEIKVMHHREPSASTMDSSLFGLLKHATSSNNSFLLPFITPGVTDSRFAREQGIPSYGYFPTPPETDVRLMHQANERISVDALMYALQQLLDIAMRYVTGDE